MPKIRSKHKKHINNELKQQKHKTHKIEIISKPILIYMPPKLNSKTTMNFN